MNHHADKPIVFRGWLFDVIDGGTDIILWVRLRSGRMVRLWDPLPFPVYAAGERSRLIALGSDLCRRGLVRSVGWESKREFWTGTMLPVLRLDVPTPATLHRFRRAALDLETRFDFFNVDLPIPQHYLYLRDVFPAAGIEVEALETGEVLGIRNTESADRISYTIPTLRALTLIAERMQPLSARSRFILEADGKVLALPVLEARSYDLIDASLRKLDPDVIHSQAGDSLLFPTLLAQARRFGKHLALDREIGVERKIVTTGRTFHSYGRVLYRGPAYPLNGRWHMDERESFFYKQTSLAGIIELARVSRIPVQRVARTSPGTAMVSVQFDTAIREGILIPWRKARAEDFKTALELLIADKGGLTYQPPVGVFENVAEIDFSQMYPTIMVTRNVSAETVRCGCCRNSVVPETGYAICERRRGLVPRSLEAILDRRRELKRLKKSAADPETRAEYDRRQAAIKWMLVSCFGYLGYKNAKFGRIEAHEAVTAFGRETLLQAKEIAEASGYRLLHALTDSLWIVGDTTPMALETLCRAITQATGIEMSLEGVYRWIVFPPSKQHPDRPVATRYFGLLETDEFKVRGLALRRSDTPPFIKAFQESLLELFRGTRTAADRRARFPAANQLVREALKQIEKTSPADLAVKAHLSRLPGKRATRTGLAAQQILDLGVPIHPGQSVHFVLSDTENPDPRKRIGVVGYDRESPIDRKEYERLVRLAAEEVVFDVESSSPNEKKK